MTPQEPLPERTVRHLRHQRSAPASETIPGQLALLSIGSLLASSKVAGSGGEPSSSRYSAPRSTAMGPSEAPSSPRSRTRPRRSPATPQRTSASGIDQSEGLAGPAPT